MKTEHLTGRGIEQLAHAVTTLADAASLLAAPLDDESRGGIADLAKLIDGIDALFVVDNLETAAGSEVVALVEAMPREVAFLFTSRVGIGELEKRLSIAS